MNKLTSTKLFFNRWATARREKEQKNDLDLLFTSVSEANSAQWTLEEKLIWLKKLIAWIGNDDDRASAKVRFLVMVLERNPTWKTSLKELLTTTLGSLQGFELFCETGLPNEFGFIGELIERITRKILPAQPIDNQLARALSVVFTRSNDAQWLRSLEDATISKLAELIGPDKKLFKNDLEEALLFLTSQIRAIGLSAALRNRMNLREFKEYPFFNLVYEVDQFLKTRDIRPFSKALHDCLKAAKEVESHLTEFGVSIAIVYQIEKLLCYLERAIALSHLLSHELSQRPRLIANFMATIVEKNIQSRSVRELAFQNSALIAKKIVERNSETGQHYISRNKSDYFSLLKKAEGGGALTVLTVYGKFFVTSLPVSHFLTGVFASLNYAVSFLFIQLFGFTLATKQPAATAPALAERLENINEREGLEELVDEIVFLFRSQMISILGNVGLVIPGAMALDWLFFLVFKTHIITGEKAVHAIDSVDIFGPTMIFAAFTGVLLWFSSIIAGWVDNWFAFHQLKRSLLENQTLRFVLGRQASEKFIHFIDRNMAGFAANISLGFLLGLSPEVLHFFGLPLEVRHVTLSSGAFAAAWSSGSFQVGTAKLIRCFVGIVSIGLINVGVSFTLAFLVAIRATQVNTPQRNAVYRALVQRLFRAPMSFFFPVTARS